MTSILIELALGHKISDPLLEYALYEVCEREHSSCTSECPVYDLNRGPVNPDSGCDCFKNGKAMLEFIRSKLKENTDE